MRWLTALFIALLLLAILQIAYYYPQMPQVMASHFDAAGAPNAWTGKNGFFALYGVILIMLTFIFRYLPRWGVERSNFRMNLPNREYWLAEERIEQTMLFFRCQMLLLGVVHLLLAIVSIQMVIFANFNAAPILDGLLFSALIAYFIFLTCWLIYFFLHFKKPD